jgi:hypothetical protein
LGQASSPEKVKTVFSKILAAALIASSLTGAACATEITPAQIETAVQTRMEELKQTGRFTQPSLDIMEKGLRMRTYAEGILMSNDASLIKSYDGIEYGFDTVCMPVYEIFFDQFRLTNFPDSAVTSKMVQDARGCL